MRRNPKLAHEVTRDPAVASARHYAIDKVTAAHLAVDLLAKIKDRDEEDYVKELEIEEKAIEHMEDAVYWFHKYLRVKLKKYEEALQNKSTGQGVALERGNVLLKAAQKELNIREGEANI